MKLSSNLPRSGGARGKGLDKGKEKGVRAARLRRWAPWFGLAYLLLAGLFVAWAKMETTQLTYEVHRLRAERTDLQREQRILTAEIATLRAPAHLSEKAVELGMIRPEPGTVTHVD